MNTASSRQGVSRKMLAFAVGALAMVLIVGLVLPSGNVPLQSALGGQSSIGAFVALAVPAYLAGIFSLLSPCCLPILPAYFSITFGAKRQRVVAMSVAFFLGLATTMVVLGASVTALGALIFPYRDLVTRVGGIVRYCHSNCPAAEIAVPHAILRA